MRRIRKSAGTIEPLEHRRLLAAEPILDLTQANVGSSPTSFTAFDGQVIFNAVDDTNTTQPYITDGTSAGTRRLKNFAADVGGNTPGNYYVWKDRVYFTINRPATGTELWSSDGSTAGTTFLADLTPGSTGTSGFVAQTPFAGKLYFLAAGTNLWRTDGTSAGTQIVASNLFPDEQQGASRLPVVNNLLFYAGSQPGSGNELRAVNSSGATMTVAELTPGSAGSFVTDLFGAGSVVFFNAIAPGKGIELFVSDGTSAGTHLVADVRPGTDLSSLPIVLGAENGHAYFTAQFDSSHRNLFYTDGLTVTNLGVTLGSGLTGTYGMTNGKLLFAFTDSAGKELWKSDGTSGGTGRLVDIVAGPGSSNPSNFRTVDGKMYFFAAGRWYSTDGTAAGTVLDPRDYPPDTPTVLSGEAVIQSSTIQVGLEPFLEDPVTKVKTLLADLRTAPQSTSVSSFFRAGPYVFFSNGGSLWRSDGTAPGTFSMGLSFTGVSASADGRLFYMSAGSLYQTDGTPQGSQLIATFPGAVNLFGLPGNRCVALVKMSDGTIASYACDLTPGSAVTQLGTYGNAAIIASEVGSAGPGQIVFTFRNIELSYLFRSDGTAAGTSFVDQSGVGDRFNIVGATSQAGYYTTTDQFGQPHGLKEIDATGARSVNADFSGGTAFFNDQLFFTSATTLYKYTYGGPDPVAIATINGPALTDGPFMRAARVGSTLYFIARDASGNPALWRSDGTSGGTTMVTSFTGGVSPQHLVGTSDRLYFDLNTVLYSSDGTAQGTGPENGVTLDANQVARAVLGDALIINNGAPNFPLMRISATPRGSISGTIFNDTNGNGQLDAGESPLADRTVYIDVNNNGGRDPNEGMKFTDSSGAYRFGGLLAGTYAVRQVLPAGWIETNAPANVTIAASQDATANLGSKFNDQAGPELLRSRQRLDHSPTELEFRFDEDIAIDPSMFTLTNLAGGSTPISPSAMVVNNDWNRLEVLLGSLNLPDGNYQLDGPGSAVADVAGHSLPGGLHFNFFILSGDANHDGVVDTADFTVLAINFNLTGATLSDGDFTGDGRINALDMNLLATKFGSTLATAQPGAARTPSLFARIAITESTQPPLLIEVLQ